MGRVNVVWLRGLPQSSGARSGVEEQFRAARGVVCGLVLGTAAWIVIAFAIVLVASR